MISNEEFVKRCLDSFDNIRKDMKELRDNITKIHDCQTRLEGQFTTHLKVEEALDLQKQKNIEAENSKNSKVDRKFYIIIAIITVSLSAVSLVALFK